MAEKRILLIRPRDNMPLFWFPLALAYLKSNIQPRYEVKILDCALREISASSPEFSAELKKFNPDIVGVSVSTLVFKEGLEILKQAKVFNKEIVTLVGGPHPSLYPEEILQHDFADFIFCGEAEQSLPLFLDKIETDKDFSSVKGLVYRKNGIVVKNEPAMEINLDKLKLPDYRAAGLEEYLEKGYSYGGFYGKTAPIWITRGCPYSCKYCSAPFINGRKIRAPSVGYVVDLITRLYNDFGIRQFTIVDDNFTFYSEYAKEFCREIIKLKEKHFFKENIYFATPNGIRLEKVDDELLVLMKKTGWDGVTIAPESGSLKTLERMRKQIDPAIVPGVVKRIRAAGLKVRAFFIVGYPGETSDDLKATIKLIRKCRLDAFVIHLFHPIPGTPVFDDLVKSGAISADFVPGSFCRAYLPLMFNKSREEKYVTPGFENFSLFNLMLRENFLLALRNPYSVIYFMKVNGFMNIMKKMFQMAKSKN